jgi:hypothetical protein
LRDASAAPASVAALSSFELDALTAGMGRGVATTSETAGAATTDTALAKAPFDTKIAYRVSGDALVFRIPPGLKGIGISFFLAFWLTGWTIGIVFAATTLVSTLPKQGETIAPTLFIGGWLLFALVSEIVVLRVLATRLAMTIAERFIICTGGTLFVVTRLWFFTRVSPYELRYVRTMTASDAIRTPMQIPDAGLQFEYGKRTVGVTGMTKAEANWVAASIAEHRPAS